MNNANGRAKGFSGAEGALQTPDKSPVLHLQNLTLKVKSISVMHDRVHKAQFPTD